MGLKAIYSSESEIPEGLAGYYKAQGDGSYKIDLEGVKTQDDVDRAMAAMEKQKQLRIEAEKDLAKFKDVDLDKWEKVKDIDPDNPPSGDGDEKEFNRRLSEAVRKKEQEIKEQNKKELDAKLAEVEQKEKAILETHKENWIKQYLSDKFGFTDSKRLRWLMLDIEAGQHPELKRKLDSIEVIEENGRPKVVGGDLKDEQGALEILENISSSEVSKDYKPAADNHGGGTPPNGGGGGDIKENPFKPGEHYNVTKQSQLIAENPAKAKILAKEAGWSEQELAGLR